MLQITPLYDACEGSDTRQRSRFGFILSFDTIASFHGQDGQSGQENWVEFDETDEVEKYEQLEGGTAPRLAVEILSETRRYAFIILSKRILFVITCHSLCRRIILLHKLANTQSTANLDLLQKLLLFLVLPQ